MLAEFDEVKRSCRKRLDGHNRRRRKPQPESIGSTSFFPVPQGSDLHIYIYIYFPFIRSRSLSSIQYLQIFLLLRLLYRFIRPIMASIYLQTPGSQRTLPCPKLIHQTPTGLQLLKQKKMQCILTRVSNISPDPFLVTTPKESSLLSCKKAKFPLTGQQQNHLYVSRFSRLFVQQKAAAAAAATATSRCSPAG